jgi:AraC family transcriptional regulator
MNFEEKEIETQKVALIKHKGKVNEARRIISNLLEWTSKNNLQLEGNPFAIYYTNPNEIPSNEMVYEIGIPIVGNPTQDSEIEVRYVPEHYVLSTIHNGEYSSLVETHMKLWKYIFKNDYEVDGFPKEIYLNNPDDVYEEELLTEIQIPVKKIYNYINPEEVPEEEVLQEIHISKKT